MVILPPVRWFHVTLTTYASWLPGDPRGFRTRGHREHVEGDYRNPPKEDYSERHRRSQSLQTQASVVIESQDRAAVAETLRTQCDYYRLDAAAIAVAGRHTHLLMKLPVGDARYVAGRLKYPATTLLKSRGYPKKIWAGNTQTKPIGDRSHWTNAFGYIARHDGQGAAVSLWTGPRTGAVTSWQSPNAVWYAKPYESAWDQDAGQIVTKTLTQDEVRERRATRKAKRTKRKPR